MKIKETQERWKIHKIKKHNIILAFIVTFGFCFYRHALPMFLPFATCTAHTATNRTTPIPTRRRNHYVSFDHGNHATCSFNWIENLLAPYYMYRPRFAVSIASVAFVAIAFVMWQCQPTYFHPPSCLCRLPKKKKT